MLPLELCHGIWRQKTRMISLTECVYIAALNRHKTHGKSNININSNMNVKHTSKNIKIHIYSFKIILHALQNCWIFVRQKLCH